MQPNFTTLKHEPLHKSFQKISLSKLPTTKLKPYNQLQPTETFVSVRIGAVFNEASLLAQIIWAVLNLLKCLKTKRIAKTLTEVKSKMLSKGWPQNIVLPGSVGLSYGYLFWLTLHISCLISCLIMEGFYVYLEMMMSVYT